MSDTREHARQLARSYASRGDFLGWFEEVYRQAGDDLHQVPWADLRPNPNLLAWAEAAKLNGTGKRAAVVGCGLGDDAEALSVAGFDIVAFDIAPTAIAAARRRFPSSSVDYQVADLFGLPKDWASSFDFVLESYTLQVLPPHMQPLAMRCIAQLVRPSGSLLIICRGRDKHEPASAGLHWLLAREDFYPILSAGLEEVRFEDYADPEEPNVRRFRAEYRRFQR